MAVCVLHCVVEVPADWPVKPSSPLSTVTHTSAASHYRSAVNHSVDCHLLQLLPTDFSRDP